MTGRKKHRIVFIAGLVVLGCALLMILLGLTDWAGSGERPRLGVPVCLASLGAVLVAVNRRLGSSEPA